MPSNQAFNQRKQTSRGTQPQGINEYKKKEVCATNNLLFLNFWQEMSWSQSGLN